MSDELPPVRYPRSAGYRPAPEDNPFNAWYWRTEIHGADAGPLAGRTIAVKDNIAVAGVPMMNGVVDARRVRARVRRHGRRPRARRRCDDPRQVELRVLLLLRRAATPTPSARPTTRGGTATRPAVRRRARPRSSPAAIVDLAIGGDQGGSVRVPSSFCGLYGMKPTYGLVPYTGAMVVEAMLDHLGPMTSSVDGQRVAARGDGRARRARSPSAAHADRRLRRRAADRRRPACGSGILTEGFGHAHSDADVDDMVRQAGRPLRRTRGRGDRACPCPSTASACRRGSRSPSRA